jgi:hypothetical protein
MHQAQIIPDPPINTVNPAKFYGNLIFNLTRYKIDLTNCIHSKLIPILIKLLITISAVKHLWLFMHKNAYRGLM